MHEMHTTRRRSAQSLLAGFILCMAPNSALANEIPAENASAPDLNGPTECQSSDSDWFLAELVDVHVTESSGGDNATFHARNHANESIGQIRIAAARDSIILNAEFADGSLALIVDPEADPEDETPRVNIQGLRAEVIHERLQAAADILAREVGGQEGWVLCGLTIAATAAACAGFETGAGAVACVAGAGVAACECLPLVSKKFEENEC